MKHLRYTTSHEWLNPEEDAMSIGITKHAQSLLGDMVYIELPSVGTEVHAGDEIGVLESVKAASEINAPISGVITEINSKAIEAPALVNKDPYEEGWLLKIKPHDKDAALEEISELLHEADYLEDLAEDH
ncbi:MAG: glycine cleavage system protein GcvH [Gammaproteobacteria bacterium]|nr:glycine cleavage system protein GcvH [Gammaproteobacteria bacterium]